MTVKLMPSPLCGRIDAVTSKSAAHRALICAALSESSETVLEINSVSNDIKTTMECLSSLGADITTSGNEILVKGIDLDNTPEKISLNCRDSGSTLRFLLPVACTRYFGEVLFSGGGRLPERPIGELLTVLSKNGAAFDSDKLPLKTKDSDLRSGIFRISGDISSQYISGILFALPLAGGGRIELTSPLQSRAYVDMTVNAMESFGVKVKSEPDGFSVECGQKYLPPKRLKIEGDWSGAAFFLAAGALGEKGAEGICLYGLDENSLQGDKAIIDILERYGARIEKNSGFISVKAGERKAFKADMSEIPDLLPVLAVLGAYARGETILYNAARLRLKESDRLKTTAEMLGAFGADITEQADSLLIRGRDRLKGGVTDSYNDHRIAMSASVAAIRTETGVTVTGAESVKKSYTDFFSEFKKLGGWVDVINNRE